LKGIFNFTQGDFITGFAEKHNIAIRGHNLIWVAHNPSWLVSQEQNLSAAEMDSIMKEHIEGVVTHYKGQVYSWDVVNEGIVDVPSPWFVHKCPNWTCALKNASTVYSG
jgi:endo-1,4-beta-xylanase